MAPEKPLLTKRRKPKPQTAGFIGGKTFQGENRQTIPEFGFAEFWSFVPLQKKTQCLRQNLVAKAAKTLVGMTGFGTEKATAKTVMSTERSEWRHLETVVKVR